MVTIGALLLSTHALSESTTEKVASLEETTRLAREGDASAQEAMAERYYFGNGVQKDGQQAVEWYSKAAAQGNAAAQFYMGAIHYNGEYVTRDFEKAFGFFSQAAAQGHRNAKTNLGVMYKNGEGVTQDELKAFEIFSETAELGDKTAQIYLAGMYYFGQGTSIDNVQAYKWALISDQVDLRKMKGGYAVASVSRAGSLAGSMSPDQIAKGRQLAGEWLKQHPDNPDSGFR